MPRPRVFTDAEILSALTEWHGMVYLAAAAIGCSAPTIYDRAKVSEAVAECMKQEDGKIDDQAGVGLSVIGIVADFT